MKKINYFLIILSVSISGLSNMSYSQQISPSEILNCNKYPTKDGQLNEQIDSLVSYNREFSLRMTSIYQELSSERQLSSSAYFERGDMSLFEVFPQFNDQQLNDSKERIRKEYLSIWKRHENLFSGLENDQRRQIISDIVMCATAKDELQRETLGNRLSDPCETERVNCIVSVGAEAAIMHVGCAALDLTLIGGIICHGAAFVYQRSAGRNCNIAAARCKGLINN